MSATVNQFKILLRQHDSLIFPLLAFLIPLLVRTIPEILMGPFVVGFDPIGYYVPFLSLIRGGLNFWGFFSVAPFFYVILTAITSIGIPAILSLKFLSVFIFGLLGVSIYFYAEKSLSWSCKKSLLVALLATLYFVSLRVSFDLLRSELALVFLFTTMIFLKRFGTNLKIGILLSLSMLLVVFSDQYISVIIFVIILATIVTSYIKKERRELGKLILFSVPAAFLFCFIIYAGLVSSQLSLSTRIIGEEIGGSMSPTALFGFSSYSNLVINNLGFLVFCYLPLVPLLILSGNRLKGNLQLRAWVVWILFIIVLSTLVPFIFFDALPYRWTILLSYPLAFFAVGAIDKIRMSKSKVALIVGAGLILATLSTTFMVLPTSSPFVYYNYYPNYIPTSMLQNTLPLRDCQDTVNSLQWIGTNMPGNGHLLAHTAFYGWALLYLNRSQIIPYGYGDPEVTASNLARNGSISPLYLIWWINGTGWYGQPTVSPAFSEAYKSGRIAVYIYNENSSVVS